MYKKVFHTILVIAVLVAAMTFTFPGKRKLHIKFENYVGNALLKLDSVSYKNASGQSYTVSMFKYYVGNFQLKNMQGQEFISKGYFLINQDDKTTMEVSIDSIPSGEYNSISFTLGVDSTDNCSGAQAGALDPVNGMFWAWNSGYIFLKMEGISPASTSTGKRLEFHIGGYREPNNCIKIIRPELKHPMKMEENNSVIIKADLSHLFFGSTSIDFSKISSVTDFHNAKSVAGNYSLMFSTIEADK